jgi:hypothetical protein
MAQIKRKVTDLDPTTGKKIIAFLTNAPIGEKGNPIFINYLLKYKEADESTDPTGNDDLLRSIYTVREYRFEINQRKISSSTLLYLLDDTVDPNAISLEDYFANKAINTFPGVNNGDAAWKYAEGILRQVILIKQANGELPS